MLVGLTFLYFPEMTPPVAPMSVTNLVIELAFQSREDRCKVHYLNLQTLKQLWHKIKQTDMAQNKDFESSVQQ